MPLSYKWKRNGVYIPGEFTNTYVVQVGDDADSILCEVKGTNAIGSALAYSNAVVIPDPKPSCTVNPIISGIPLEGQVLTVTSDGVWIGAPTITFSYQWRRNGVDIGGEVFNNYTLVAADAGCQIDCEVIGTNMYDSATAYSNFLIPSASLVPPTIVTPPSITGTGTTAGSVLTINDGTWAGSPTITFSRQWLRNGIPISGETGTTYTLLTTDVGDSIDCIVVATNPVTSVPYITYGIVVEGPPVNIQIPIIYGSYVLGGLLTLQNGVYSGYPTPTLSWVWQLSTDGGSTWNNIVGTTGSATYTVQPGDVGNQIRVIETATNGITPNAQSISNVAIIIAATVQRPENTVAPNITGNLYIGQVLTVSNGTWNGSPTGYNYQWYRGVTPIGTNTNTYTLVIADTNELISCVVTATNSGGNQPATSNSVYAYDADFYAVVLFAIAQGYSVPTTAQQQHFSRFVKELKDFFMWLINDRFYVMAQNGSANFGRINWRSPSLSTLLTITNAGAFASNLGWLLNGTTQFINTGYVPSVDGVNYTLNNAGRYAYLMTRTSSVGINYAMDGNLTQNNSYKDVRGAAQNNVKINGTANLATQITTSFTGYHAITREDATNINNYVDTPTINTQAQASISLPSEAQLIGRNGSSYYGGYIGWYAIGGAIPAANLITHKNIISKYMTNL